MVSLSSALLETTGIRYGDTCQPSLLALDWVFPPRSLHAQERTRHPGHRDSSHSEKAYESPKPGAQSLSLSLVTVRVSTAVSAWLLDWSILQLAGAPLLTFLSTCISARFPTTVLSRTCPSVSSSRDLDKPGAKLPSQPQRMHLPIPICHHPSPHTHQILAGPTMTSTTEISRQNIPNRIVNINHQMRIPDIPIGMHADMLATRNANKKSSCFTPSHDAHTETCPTQSGPIIIQIHAHTKSWLSAWLAPFGVTLCDNKRLFLHIDYFVDLCAITRPVRSARHTTARLCSPAKKT
jgi:hypothetical protein